MLTNAQPVCFVLTAAMAKARSFYTDTLCLTETGADPYAISYDLAGTMLRLTKVEDHVASPHTVLGWQVTDIAATIKALRDAGCEKVGVVGYCLGALLAYLTACRADSDASVGYYGVGIDGRLEEADAIAQPLMLHIATEDGFVSKEAQAAVHARLNAHPRCTLHDYAADHAFARAIGSSRVPDLAELADRRTAAFFRDNL